MKARTYAFDLTMSTHDVSDAEVVVIGAGIVGCATALALARRQVPVALLEAEPAPGLGASGSNSGILHTGFDSPPGELETELILRSGTLRAPVLAALQVPVLPCGALMSPRDEREREAILALAANARRNGVGVAVDDDGTLAVTGEAVTDPVAFTLALAGAAERHGAVVRTGWRAVSIEPSPGGLRVGSAHGEAARCRVAVNCAGLGADAVARLAGDGSFQIYPRKGEFLVFEPVPDEPLERILLPVPARQTKGVLVFPTVDGKIVAGPTAIDQQDKDDWSVRPQAHDEILRAASRMYPPLGEAEPIAAYAGLRPAGRGVNYLIGVSNACPRLVNIAAIRSTGLTASLAIAERACALVAQAGVPVGSERPLTPAEPVAVDGPWWRRVPEHRLR
jgi:glycerol-3-phosphate dehydrogenase